MDAIPAAPPPPDRQDPPGAGLVAAAAGRAITEVQAAVRELACRSGRAGLIAALRRRADDLATSGVAFHQIERLALHAAADDIAWGRAPLGGWRTFFGAPPPSLAAARAEIRLKIGAGPELGRAMEDAVAVEVEHHITRQAGEAFLAARDRWALLEDAAGLQAALWDDARISAGGDTRRRMRAGEHGLRRLLASRPRPAGPDPDRRPALWRRVLSRMGATGEV